MDRPKQTKWPVAANLHPSLRARSALHNPRMNEISHKPACTVTELELASARQHQKTGRPSWSARWRVSTPQPTTTGQLARAGIPGFAHASAEKNQFFFSALTREKQKKNQKNTPKNTNKTPTKHQQNTNKTPTTKNCANARKKPLKKNLFPIPAQMP